MTLDLSEISHQMLAAAKRHGADAADALVVNGTSLSVEVLNGALEHAEQSEGTDLGLRVLIGQQQATVSVSDTRADAIEEMAERAVSMAKLAPIDPHCGLAQASEIATAWDCDVLKLADPAPSRAPAEFQALALEAEAAANAHKDISQVQSSAAGYSNTSLHLATSEGFSGGYQRTNNSISCVAIAGEGTSMERDYCGEVRTFFDDLPDPKEIGDLAAVRTLERVGSSQPPTGSFPVLFDERISSSLIAHFLSSINGSMIVRGSSWLKDAMGQDVLPKGIDLIEDPTRPFVAGSKPFDAEGLLTTPKHIVKDGVLSSWVLDLATARALEQKSTANAARSVSAPPMPSSGNIDITQSAASKDSLISQMGTGLVVTSLIGSTINPNTGDYSRGAAGFWVENGEIVRPVSGCTIAGNLGPMLRSIIPANDAQEHLSRRIPSLLVEGLTIAGV